MQANPLRVLLGLNAWPGLGPARVQRMLAAAGSIEELARERDASTIELTLVEEGIEIGKKMMAEMIATYQGPPSTGSKPMLNEVSPLTARDPSTLRQAQGRPE